MIGLGVALCLAAGGFGARPLYVPGIALPLLAVGATVWVSAAVRGARVIRSLESRAVEEDMPLRVSVCVTRSGVPLPGAEARPWAGGPAQPLSGSLSGDAPVSASARFPRRGRQALPPASVLISDPLGLCRRTILSAGDDVLVLPRVEPLRFAEVDGPGANLRRRRAGAAEAGAADVDSLQPHQPGAPASRIHWPTVARTGTLMERRLVAESARSPFLVVDPREPASADALDRAMRAAASLCVHLARGGGCAVVLPGDRRPTRIDGELYGFSELHARLALLHPDAGGPPLGLLIGATTVLWVTAATHRPASLAALRAPLRYLISPHPAAHWPVRFTAAGCGGQQLSRDTASQRVA